MSEIIHKFDKKLRKIETTINDKILIFEIFLK